MTQTCVPEMPGRAETTEMVLVKLSRLASDCFARARRHRDLPLRINMNSDDGHRGCRLLLAILTSSLQPHRHQYDLKTREAPNATDGFGSSRVATSKHRYHKPSSSWGSFSNLHTCEHPFEEQDQLMATLASAQDRMLSALVATIEFLLPPLRRALEWDPIEFTPLFPVRMPTLMRQLVPLELT